MTSPMILTPTQAGLYLGVASNTLRAWRVEGTGPAYIRLSARMIGYHVEDLAAWVAEHRVNSPATAPTPRLHAAPARPESGSAG